MAPITKVPKSSNKKQSILKSANVSTQIVKSPQKFIEVSEEEDEEHNEEEEGEEDSDDEGVDEEGMERLMKALGDDGLDDFDRVQLNLALGEEEDWSTDENDEEGEEDVPGVEKVSSGEDGDNEDEDDGNADEDEDEDTNKNDTVNEREEDIALDDVESVDGDVVPRQKIEIDNTVALQRIRETIKLDPSFPWTETLVLSYPETISVDVNDDLNRELAFYKQALHGAKAARALAAKHNFAFTRPADYFAEMVKTDSHMERIRQRLLDESASIKKSEDKRKEREGKKFGKQVQVEKLKEREKAKKDIQERLKGLKRKRKDVLDNPQADDDAFDIAVEDALTDRPTKRSKSTRPERGKGITRHARDSKYGFGGGGRRAKQNTRESTDNLGSKKSGRGGRGGGRGGARGGARGSRGGGNKRPGKARRIAARSKP